MNSAEGWMSKKDIEDLFRTMMRVYDEGGQVFWMKVSAEDQHGRVFDVSGIAYPSRQGTSFLITNKGTYKTLEIPNPLVPRFRLIKFDIKPV